MKILKHITTVSLALCLLVTSSCSSFTNTGKGAAIGGGSGAALGAGLGALINGGKGAGIGAAIGAAVGAGAGLLIGRKMDKQKAELEQSLQGTASVDTVTDSNGLTAIRVTFPGGILFPTNGTTLSADARKSLTKFAASLLANPDTNVEIYGYTDNTGTMQVNTRVADGRAQAVRTYLLDSGVAASRLSAQGCPMTDYVAPNTTPEGRAQNRRVDVYIVASKAMIEKAENGQLN